MRDHIGSLALRRLQVLIHRLTFIELVPHWNRGNGWGGHLLDVGDMSFSP